MQVLLSKCGRKLICRGGRNQDRAGVGRQAHGKERRIFYVINRTEVGRCKHDNVAMVGGGRLVWEGVVSYREVGS